MYLAHSRLIPAFTAPSTGIFNQPMNVFSQPVNAFSQPVNAFSQPVNAFSQPTAQPSLYQPIMGPASAECPKYSPMRKLNLISLLINNSQFSCFYFVLYIVVYRFKIDKACCCGMDHKHSSYFFLPMEAAIKAL